MGWDGECFEDAESREIRERYNRNNQAKGLNSSFNRSSAVVINTGGAEDVNLFALPTPAGVVMVDLNEIEKNTKIRDRSGSPQPSEGSAAGDERVSFRRRGLRNSQAKPDNGSRGVLGMGRSRKSSRETKRPRTTLFRSRNRSSDSDSSKDLDRGGRSSPDAELQIEKPVSDEEIGLTLDNEQLAIELLDFELPPRQAAEDAKATATRSAQMRENYVSRELEVRQMWKGQEMGGGGAPGLKAELAKLHATEQAKLIYREYEMQAAKSNAPSSPIKTPVLVKASLPPPPPLEETLPSAPPATIESPNLHVGASSAPRGRGDAPPPVDRGPGGRQLASESAVRRGGSSGVLGWMWSLTSSSSSSKDEPKTPHEGERQRRPAGFDGPFTA